MKKLILSLAAVAALASCATNENETPVLGNDDPVEIKVGYASLEATTKTPFEGTISGTNKLVAKVMASKVSGNYTTANLLTNGVIEFLTNETKAYGFNTPVYYPDNNPVYLIGMYPTDEFGSWTVDAMTATRKIDGKSDIMFATEQQTTKATNGEAVLTFNHLLTKLDISIKADGEEDQEAWKGQSITKIELLKAGDATPSSQVAVTIADGTTNFTTGTDAVTPCYTYVNGEYKDAAYTTGTAVPTTTEQQIAYVICEPIDPDGTADYTLQLTIGGQTYDVEVGCANHASLTSGTAGYEIDVLITFHGTAITAMAKVTPWADGGAASGQVGGDNN